MTGVFAHGSPSYIDIFHLQMKVGCFLLLNTSDLLHTPLPLRYGGGVGGQSQHDEAIIFLAINNNVLYNSSHPALGVISYWPRGPNIITLRANSTPVHYRFSLRREEKCHPVFI